jgi:hypothetical protein
VTDKRSTTKIEFVIGVWGGYMLQSSLAVVVAVRLVTVARMVAFAVVVAVAVVVVVALAGCWWL